METQADKLGKILDAAAEKLSDHCDSIQIIATIRDDNDGSTMMVNAGRGCQFSRIKAAEMWAEQETEWFMPICRTTGEE